MLGVMVKNNMSRQIIMFFGTILLLFSIPVLGNDLFVVNDCVLTNSCDIETSKLKKHLLHATGIFEVLEDPYSGLDDIKVEFYDLQRKNSPAIHMGVVYMWSDHSVFILNPSKSNTHYLEIVQILNFGRINNIIKKDIDSDGNYDVNLTNFTKVSEPQSLIYLNKCGRLQRP
jgi:hypothetical protein